MGVGLLWPSLTLAYSRDLNSRNLGRHPGRVPDYGVKIQPQWQFLKVRDIIFS